MDSEEPTIDPRIDPEGESSTRGPAGEGGSESSTRRIGGGTGSSFLSSKLSGMSFGSGRFERGELIGERYRVTGLLGKGGMGEVYRAHDVAIDQEVAIKLLPEEVGADPTRAELFINELRLARQVTHPNVCRVHDIGEAEGRLYLTMELVEGEPLSRVIRRLGRLPDERAVQIARQLCAGLAAAHAKGIVHRDLKPANIMIDDEGVPKILDFGVAAVAAQVPAGEASAGTPNYMAPEQLEGEGVSERSDLFSLGLVLYEMFTGRPAIRARSLEELRRIHKRQPIADPAETGLAIHPAVERAVLACLQRDPLARPAKARIVSAMLPGGDALAEAIAAGETPSPELVAAAGGAQRLRPLVAVLLLVASLLSTGLAVLLMERANLAHRVPLEKPDEVLAYDARRLLTQLGHESEGVHRAYSFDLYEEYLDEIVRRDESAGRWDRLSRPRPAPIDFWYRQSPTPIMPRAPDGIVRYNDPPQTTPGMINVRLDPLGRLRELIVTRAPGLLPESPTVEPDARALFDAAGLDIGAFERVEPTRIPQAHADALMAWRGVYPESPEVGVRVEAGWLGGEPVAFRIVEEQWDDVAIATVGQTLQAHAIATRLERLVLALVLVGSLVLAVQNVRRRRGDREGAIRLAGSVFGLELIGSFMLAHHPASMPALVERAWILAAFACGQGAIMWLLYVAIEPYARRIWPETLITWTRLVQGRWRDPGVGQSVLVGVLLGMATLCVFLAGHMSGALIGRPPETPLFEPGRTIHALGGPSHVLGLIGVLAGDSVRFSLVLLAGLVIVRLMIKHRWAAAVLYGAVYAVVWTLYHEQVHALNFAASCVMAALAVVTLVRFGLLALVAAHLCFSLVMVFPVTLDPSRWLFGPALVAVAIPVALAVGAAIVSVGASREGGGVRLPAPA